MKLKFHIATRIVDMEHPTRNQKDEKDVFVDVDEQFEKHGEEFVFKVLSGTPSKVVLEYDRHYAVKNEHKGYEYNTTLDKDDPKEVTSMWGKNQITMKITYLGMEEE